jgi:hypothetical protein
MQPTDRRLFRYVLAFAAGAICTLLITRFLFHSRPAPATILPERAPARAGESSSVEELQPRRQTFQRLPRSLAAAPSPEVANRAPENSSSQSEATPIESAEPPAVVRVVEHVNSAAIPAAGVAADTGRLSGKITLLGQPPAEQRLPLDAKCAAKAEKVHAPTTTRRYVVGNDQGLADVIVSLQGIPSGSFDAHAKTNVIIQQACEFEPYISAVLAGGTILVQNKDDLRSLFRFDSKENGTLSKPLYRSASLTFTLNHAESEVRLRNEDNIWQFAYITVFDHPYFAVTDKNGDFVIPAIPPGHYTVQARHRKAGIVTKEVTIEANRNANLEFAMPVSGPQTASTQ